MPAAVEIENDDITAKYNGKPHYLPEIKLIWGEGKILEKSEYTVESGGAVSAGTYFYEVVLLSGNFTFGASDRAKIKLTVERAQAEISASSLTVVYDGQMHGITPPEAQEWVDESGIIIAYNGFSSAPVNAGEYEVKITVAEKADYLGADLTVTLVILKKTVSVIWQEEAFEYDGAPKTPDVRISDGESEVLVNLIYFNADGVRLKSAPSDVGNYKAVASLSDSRNFELIGELEKDFTIIGKTVPGETARIEYVALYIVLAIQAAVMDIYVPVLLNFVKKSRKK